MKNNKEEMTIVDIKQNIIAYSTESLNMEKDREEKILNSCNSNVTSISILLATLMIIIFELLNRLNNLTVLIIIFSSILTVILLLSMFFSIKAQWFYKKKFKRTATAFMEHINNHRDAFISQEAFLDQQIADLDNIQSILATNNDKRVRDVMVASIFLYIFLGLLLVFGIIILIVAV